MNLYYEFFTPATMSDLREGIDFLAAQDLEYPGYREVWVPKAEAECISGQKTMILARSNRKIIGDVIFQPHKQLPRIREIKNLRIHPEFRDRFFGGFMLKQAEKINPQEYDALIVDAREGQDKIVEFLMNQGYRVIAVESLYEKSKREVVMAKARHDNFDLFSLAA